ncbi:MAG: hypothetical protein FWE35_26865, partial [Streptosporangiales bacterium]|nr:hypothetical protein [Streptosporangiales bacterium]
MKIAVVLAVPAARVSRSPGRAVQRDYGHLTAAAGPGPSMAPHRSGPGPPTGPGPGGIPRRPRSGRCWHSSPHRNPGRDSSGTSGTAAQRPHPARRGRHGDTAGPGAGSHGQPHGQAHGLRTSRSAAAACGQKAIAGDTLVAEVNGAPPGPAATLAGTAPARARYPGAARCLVRPLRGHRGIPPDPGPTVQVR